jgi:hypothetical protein
MPSCLAWLMASEVKFLPMLVADWLTLHMFKGDPNAAKKAGDIGRWLADHAYFKTHGRPISRDAAKQGRVLTQILHSV